MAARKLLTRRVVVGMAWGGWMAAFLVLFAMPQELEISNAILLLTLAVVAMLVSILCAVMLVIVYRKFFARGGGVATLMTVLTLGRWLTSRSVLPGRVELVVNVLVVDTMVSLGIGLALALYQHDAALPLVGWLSVTILWAVLIASRLQGNLVELALRQLGDPADHAFWWLDSLMCLLWWAVPLGALSFLWHTLCLIRKEVRGERE